MRLLNILKSLLILQLTLKSFRFIMWRSPDSATAFMKWLQIQRVL